MKKSYFTTNSKNHLIIHNLTNISFKNNRQKASFERYYKRNISEGKDINKRIKLEGKWLLSNENQLKFRIHGAESVFLGQYIIFNGSLTTPKSGSFGFRIENSRSLKNIQKSSIELNGRWFADLNNRISFKAINYTGKNNKLRLQGAWKTNKKNELIYEIVSEKKKKIENTLTFKGYWEIDSNKLIYSLGIKGSDSFIFKSELINKTLIRDNKYIKSSVNIEYFIKRFKCRVKRTVALKGTWEIKNNLKASFTIVYANGKQKEIAFNVKKAILRNGKLSLFLVKKTGKNVLLRLEFTKKMKKDIDLFIRLSKKTTLFKKPEYSIVGGATIRFYWRPYEINKRRTLV